MVVEVTKLQMAHMVVRPLIYTVSEIGLFGVRVELWGHVREVLVEADESDQSFGGGLNVLDVLFGRETLV